MSESTRPAKFFRITVGLFAALLLFGVALAVLLMVNADRINRDGGWGFLMAIFVFVAATAVVGVGTAVTSALSLRNGEAHRGFSTGVLIVSSLVVLMFGTGLVRTTWSQWRMSQEDARTRARQEPRVFGDGGMEIPDSLAEHFRRQGFPIRPAQDQSSNREYVVDVADIGARCDVLVSFRGFARATPVAEARQQLMRFNAATVLNEHARLAMFYPFGRGTTGDKGDCEAFAAKSKEIAEPILDAFRSYRP